MKIDYKGQFFYIRSGPEYANELSVEEFNGYWQNSDETRRTEIFYTSKVIGLALYPDLFEVHFHIQGRKGPKLYKFANAEAYEKFITVLQSGLNFDLT